MWTRRRWWLLLLGVLAVGVVVAFDRWQAAIQRNRSIPDEPFRIAGNLHYVGSTAVTAFLLTGPEGHVLIDGGYPETAPLIVASIAKLGYSITDVKVLLNSHAHFDHAGGLAELQRASGAELWVSEGDADVLAAGGAGDVTFGPIRHLGFLGWGRFDAPRVDHRFADGDTIRVGPLAVSICSLTLLPFTYPGQRAHFEHSFRTLRSLPADIFLASHGSMLDLARKRRERRGAADPVAPFVDREGHVAHIERAERQVRAALAAH
jgi:metallo-beta-lactamase class B